MESYMNIALLIMAAGKGSRFKLKDHKQCISIAGKPAITRFLERTQRLEIPSYVLLNKTQPQEVKDVVVASKIDILWQPKQDGTGGALQTCVEQLEAKKKLPDYFLVMNADMPCVQTETLKSILERFQKKDKCFQMVTTAFPFETGFGRVFQKEFSIDIIEHKDCSSEELDQGMVNTGIYWLPTQPLLKAIPHLPTHKSADEKYITDLFRYRLIKRSGARARLVHQKSWQDFLGMNTTLDLMRAEDIIQEQIHEQLTEGHVHFKGRGYIEESVKIGKGSVIFPNVTLTGKTIIGEGVTIESGAKLHDATVGNQSHIFTGSVIEDSSIGETCSIGPHARLRKSTQIGNQCRIGNFVEMKNTKFGNQSKAAHLSYVGDSDVGKRVNISCGVITCNYDGSQKHKTVIEDDVFVGSDVQLIAPILIGKGSYIASGSTINQNMENGDFAIARSRQTTKKGMASRFIQKKNGMV
jgi:bifunctional UDP-N-acetylglucosamine pyrophosphorylase / glucosamine-1-phosphate N-acetyltransferase